MIEQADLTERIDKEMERITDVLPTIVNFNDSCMDRLRVMVGTRYNGEKPLYAEPHVNIGAIAEVATPIQVESILSSQMPDYIFEPYIVALAHVATEKPDSLNKAIGMLNNETVVEYISRAYDENITFQKIPDCLVHIAMHAPEKSKTVLGWLENESTYSAYNNLMSVSSLPAEFIAEKIDEI